MSNFSVKSFRLLTALRKNKTQSSTVKHSSFRRQWPIKDSVVLICASTTPIWIKFKRVRHQLHRVMDCIRTVYFRKTLAAMRCVYNVFERYFDLRYIVISKEYLQPDIGAVPSFFQEVALQWSSFFKGTMFFWNKHLQSSLFLNGVELIRHYSCSHLFVE